MNRNSQIRRLSYLLQIVSVSLGFIVFFAALYWAIDTLNWGWVLSREGNRADSFLSFLYFSMGTFFRIGYGDQVPVGLTQWIAGLEAMSNFAIEILIITEWVTAALEKSTFLHTRERLENLLPRRR
jgi:hypothetical protein